jgi:hypothetical protein
MSIGLLGAFGLMLSVLLAISEIKSSCARFCIPFGLCFGRKPSVSHLRPFGCQCFVLKHGNLDKFESHSLMTSYLAILLMADLIECLTLRLTLLLSHVM